MLIVCTWSELRAQDNEPLSVACRELERANGSSNTGSTGTRLLNVHIGRRAGARAVAVSGAAMRGAARALFWRQSVEISRE